MEWIEGMGIDGNGVTLPEYSDIIGLSAAEVRAALQLAPHPEGGWYRETWRDEPAEPGKRGAATVILFLLSEGEASAWHRVDANEIWLWHAGAALDLDIAEGASVQTIRLGAGLNFQAVVPAFAWQAARSTGAWSLVSCIVAPAFDFAGFELAPPGMVWSDMAPP
jgi:predicted cupin superfamily sugar epimerase